MLESILASTGTTQSLSIASTLLILAGALALGLLISRAYIWTHREEGYAPLCLPTIPAFPVKTTSSW